MHNIFNYIKSNSTIQGLIWIFGIVTIILIYYEPAWQTNDDPTLDMLINGYGLANRPAELIFHCNFIWASLVRMIPNWHEYSSYTLALYFFSILSVCAIWINLNRYQTYRLILVFILTSMLFYNLLNPQYTVTAFYCAIAAITGILARIHSHNWFGLSTVFILGLASFIIRDMSFLMIAILSLFIIPWSMVFNDKMLCGTLVASLFLMTFVFFYDYGQKSNFHDWDKINAWHKTRQFLSDSNIVDAFMKEPELLEKYNFSMNDMEMLHTHFSLAPDLRDVNRIEELKKSSNFLLYLKNKIINAKKAIDHFFTYPICLLLGICVFLFVQRYSRRNMLTFFLIFIVFFMIGFLNRGGIGVDRLYYAPLYLFMLSMLMDAPNSRLSNYIWIAPSLNKMLIITMAIFSILAFSKINLIDQWRYQKYDLQKTKEYLDGAVWAGWPFLIEKIYYPFHKLSDVEKIKFQSGSWNILLPDSVNFFDVFKQDSFKEFMQKGFKYAASQRQISELGIYCREHLKGEWDAKLISPPECFTIYEVKCTLPSTK